MLGKEAVINEAVREVRTADTDVAQLRRTLQWVWATAHDSGFEAGQADALRED